MTAAIILAGGLGTRLREAVPDVPKPMAPVRGRPFLAHQMDHWIAQGVKRFILSVGYRAEAITGFFGNSYRGVAIDYVIETAPLGTGGGLLLAAARLRANESALLLNGDTYFDVSLSALSLRARQHDAHWVFALFRNPDPQRYMGVGLAPDGRISALREPSAPLANGGVYLFRSGALHGLVQRPGEALSLENDLFPQLFAGGQRFAGIQSGGSFIDIGVPHDYHRAGEVLPDHIGTEARHVVAH